MSQSGLNAKFIRRWIAWTFAVFVTLFCVLILPTLVRKARLIRHVEEVGGFFYSYHPPIVKKLLGKKHYTVKSFIVPKLEPLLGRHWPGIFKDITQVQIDLRRGGSEWNLEYLRHQSKIHWLDIEFLPVQNDEIKVLETLPSLRSLRISIERLDAEGITTLAGLEKVEVLYLTRRDLTEEEARILTKMDLKWLGMDRAYVSPEPSKGVALFKEMNPNCKIFARR